MSLCALLGGEESVLALEVSDGSLEVRHHLRHLTSPGGDTDALRHVIAAVREHQSRGVSYQTRVVSYAGSAAAVLATAGDFRSAAPGAMLLFHPVRQRREDALTAQAAREVSDYVSTVDQALLDELIVGALFTRLRPTREASADLSDRPVLEALWPIVARRRKRMPAAVDAFAKPVCDYVERAIEAEDTAALRRLYAAMLCVEQPVSAVLARTLRLIDWVGTVPDPGPAASDEPGVTVPEWRTLYPPDGLVPRSALSRHVLVLGETGSGKTASVVLPLLAALVRVGPDTLGAALVVDPKGELAPVVEALAPDRYRLVEPATLALNVMSGTRWSLDQDFAAGRWLTAAHKVLLRTASFVPTSPARVLVPHQRNGDCTGEFFDREGTAFATCVLALVLRLLVRGVPAYAHLLGPAPDWRDGGAFGDAFDDADILSSGFGQPCHREVGAWLQSFEARAEAGSSALQLAAWALASPLVAPHSCGSSLLSCVVEVVVAEPGVAGALCEDGEFRERVLGYWARMMRIERQFAGVLGAAMNACVDFASPCAARSLYLGCEPGYRASPHRLDLAAAVSPRSEYGPLLVVQPARDDLDTLVTLALKTCLYEAVLDDPDRARGGAGLPLVAIVADEAHRFVTSEDAAYLDSARSYGGTCVFATHGLASVRFALAHGTSSPQPAKPSQ